MELFDAYKIVDAKKRLLRNILFITLIGLTVVFFSSFLVFNGVVIEKAEELTEENIELVQENEKLVKEIANCNKGDNKALLEKIKGLERALEEKDMALASCMEKVDSLNDLLSTPGSDIQEDDPNSLENDLRICRRELDKTKEALEDCQRDLKTMVDPNEGLAEILEKTRSELKECQEALAQEEINHQNCRDENKRLKALLDDCNKKSSGTDKYYQDKITDLEKQLRACNNDLGLKDEECADKLNELRKQLNADWRKRLNESIKKYNECAKSLEACLAREKEGNPDYEACIKARDDFKRKYNQCVKDLKKCRAKANQNTCDLEIVMAYKPGLNVQKYLIDVENYLDKRQGANTFKVRKINQVPYKYIKEIKINGVTKVNFFKL